MIRTLVVEDDPRLADAHARYVERVPGFGTVGVVHEGREALRFVAEREVDLVLLDFYLPDMTGLEVCRALRARGSGVDVIAVTSARRRDRPISGRPGRRPVPAQAVHPGDLPGQAGAVRGLPPGADRLGQR